MKPVYLIALLGPAALLAACGEKAGTNATAANMSAEAPAAMAGTDTMSGDMGNMAMPAAKTAKGTGTVTAIDNAAGTVTLDHGPLAEAGWPAMTMAFKAKPELLGSVAVVEKVKFDLALSGGAGEVTAIRKQP